MQIPSAEVHTHRGTNIMNISALTIISTIPATRVPPFPGLLPQEHPIPIASMLHAMRRASDGCRDDLTIYVES